MAWVEGRPSLVESSKPVPAGRAKVDAAGCRAVSPLSTVRAAIPAAAAESVGGVWDAVGPGVATAGAAVASGCEVAGAVAAALVVAGAGVVALACGELAAIAGLVPAFGSVAWNEDRLAEGLPKKLELNGVELMALLEGTDVPAWP